MRSIELASSWNPWPCRPRSLRPRVGTAAGCRTPWPCSSVPRRHRACPRTARLGEALSVELAPAVPVTTLSPGLMDTGFNAASGFQTPKGMQRFATPPPPKSPRLVSSGSCYTNALLRPKPASLTRTSGSRRLEIRRAASRAAARASERLAPSTVTSTPHARRMSSASRYISGAERAVSARSQPRCASWRANSLPSPPGAPVMSARGLPAMSTPWAHRRCALRGLRDRGEGRNRAGCRRPPRSFAASRIRRLRRATPAATCRRSRPSSPRPNRRPWRRRRPRRSRP